MQFAPISGYRIYWVDATGQRLGVAKEWPDGPGDKTWNLLPGTVVPPGTETFEAVAAEGQRESSPARVRADNYPRPRDLELDIGGDLSFDSESFLAQAKDGSRVLISVGMSSSNRAWVRRCSGDGALCTRHDLGAPGRYGIPFAKFPAFMHDNAYSDQLEQPFRFNLSSRSGARESGSERSDGSGLGSGLLGRVFGQ